MIDYKDIEQGTIEWHELRWGKIGGTASGGLLNNKKGVYDSNDTLLHDILSQRLEDFEPSESFENEAMQRGHELEPFARTYISDYVGVEFIETGWLQSEENELLGLSPDGITLDYRKACEIKCLGRKSHLEVLLSQTVPLKYIPQCIHYFTINDKLEQLYFLAFRPEAPKHFIKELDLDSIVNIGTNATKYELSIRECVEMVKENADKMLKQIIEEEAKINF